MSVGFIELCFMCNDKPPLKYKTICATCIKIPIQNIEVKIRRYAQKRNDLATTPSTNLATKSSSTKSSSALATNFYINNNEDQIYKAPQYNKVYHLPIEKNKRLHNISLIVPKVYISDYVNSLKYDVLKSLGIKQILTVGCNMLHTVTSMPASPSSTAVSATLLSNTAASTSTPSSPSPTSTIPFTIMTLDTDDNEDISRYITQANKFIEADSTLVHCRTGRGHSVKIVTHYLMYKYRLNLLVAGKLCNKQLKK